MVTLSRDNLRRLARSVSLSSSIPFTAEPSILFYAC
jgi:hypothetical protein